jgi:hypothetical protein
VGRGLSDLQRWILKEAASRDCFSAAEARRLHMAEILVGYFGWRPENRGSLRDNSHHFDRLQIGLRTYQNVKSALCRSVRRLEERGLVKHWIGLQCAAVSITSKGRAWLSVNQWHLVNRKTDGRACRPVLEGNGRDSTWATYTTEPSP